MKHIVTSRDGHQFVTESDAKSVPFDQAYAAVRPASELALHGDFTPLHDPGAEQAAAEFVFEGPRIVGPLERRAAFRVIKGGKP